MSIYALLVVTASVVAALMGVGAVPLIAGAWVILVSGALDANYMRWRRRFQRSSSRSFLDRYAHAQVIGAGPVLLGTGLILTSADWTPFDGAGLLAKVVVTCLAAAVTVILLSSHIDWFWILPRVSGVVSNAPCETAGAEQWTYVTAHWLFHRLMAELLVSACIIAAPAYLAAVTHGGYQVLATVILVLLTSAIALRERYVVPAIVGAGDPAAKVGEVVRIRHEIDERDVWSWAYVVDISIKGAKVILLSDDGLYRGPAFARKADYLLVSNDTLQGARRQDGALQCGTPERSCSGVNWYCRCNPRAHIQSLPDASRQAHETSPPQPAEAAPQTE